MARKQLPDDFRDFIHFLNENKVKYLLVGGWAVGLYSNPRATGDIDFLIAIDDDNLDKLKGALAEFGAPPIEIDDFKAAGNFFRMGRPPIQIDIITEADGIEIDECYSRRETINIDGIPISLISKQDLIKNKKESGRLRDLADAEALEEI